MIISSKFQATVDFHVLNKAVITHHQHPAFLSRLFGEQYLLNEFSAVYHGRWRIEELYKISKEFVDIEDFHGKSARGVRQE